MSAVKFLGVSLITLALTACGQPGDQSSDQGQKDTAAHAKSLAQELLIVDTHIDVPHRLQENGWIDVSRATKGGDFDLPRARKGGLNAPFMSIYTPASLGATDAAFTHAEDAIQLVERVVSSSNGQFAIAKSTSDVEQAFKGGVIALPLGMENGAPIGMDLAKLNHFHARGIRYITLAHSKANQISDSSYDENRPNDGLSDFGYAVVRRMNQLGIMVDISHVSDKAFYDVMEASQAPVIASHSSVRKFTPGFERNMNDDMIKTLAKNGGVIMINYGSSFVTEAANTYSKPRDAAYEAYLKETGITDSEEIKDQFQADYRTKVPYPYATLDNVLDHIDHVVALVGIDYVGIGSDYDGVGDSLPVGLKDVASYPSLIEGLLKRGYSDSDIEKILSANLMRVWRQVEAKSHELQHPAE